jgi:hypothetical protein
MSTKYTKIPVVLSFDYNAPIGELIIDTSQLPKTADFCLSISYRAGVVSVGYPDTYEEIICISPVMDLDYIKYLDNKNACNNKLS